MKIISSPWRKLSFLILFISFSWGAVAKEGMWIPSLIDKFNVSDMQSMGMKITAEELYSVNQSSIKDAVVQFGGGCTAEIISNDGLLLTNHHCGFSRIQSHSTVENDYLKNGFWAMQRSEELPNKGLTVTFIIKMEDVTNQVLSGLNEDGSNRAQIIKDNIDKITQEEQSEFNKVKIKPFNFGNSYFMLVTKTYEDVRLVGAPPSAIGKFGGDTDNWMWPRHTGDFSMFRIYANGDNQPAEYSEDNQPYHPKKFLKINVGHKSEGDFTMVYGFPGSTEQHLVSNHVQYIIEKENPSKIKMREKSLSVIDAAMAESDELRIMYAAKQSSISNAYKKWIGQNNGLINLDAVQIKKDREAEFVQKAKSNSEMAPYAKVVEQLKNLHLQYEDDIFGRAMFIEYIYYGPEFIRFAQKFTELVEGYEDMSEAKVEETLETLRKSVKGHFANHRTKIDREIFNLQTAFFKKEIKATLQPEIMKNNDVQSLDEMIFEKSYLTNEIDLLDLLQKSPKSISKKLKDDAAYTLVTQLYDVYRSKLAPNLYEYDAQFNQLMQLYTKAKQLLYPDQKQWMDANFTLRITYGKLEGSAPHDGMKYLPYTTAKGIIQKYQTGNKDYEIPEKLITLLENEDYESYAQDGELWVCFTASNHTSGGNSGSPVLDANGYLSGLNFDRSWESTMSDIMFDPSRCRNIAVDIRYVLWVIDKYAGATHLIEEMELVKNDNSSLKVNPETLKMNPQKVRNQLKGKKAKMN